MIDVIGCPSSNSKAVHYAFQELGIESRIIEKPSDLFDSKKMVLPGVGAFGSLALFLKEEQFVDPLKNRLKDGAKLLGICLGMQMLALDSEESNDKKGLELLDLRCLRFQDKGLRVPHTGWDEASIIVRHEILDGLSSEFSAFYSHSYYIPFHPTYSVASTEYGTKFSSVIASRNIVGVQFHPERSQANGRRVLANFAGW